jgi:hypothetical protein
MVALGLVAVVASCSSAAPSAPGTAGTSPGTPAARSPTTTPGVAASGIVSGRATYADGEPLPGANVVAIAVEYNLEASGQTGPDGEYRLELPERDANYRVVAWVERDYSGRRYQLPLVPEGSTDTRFHGTEGRAQNFVWQISGAAPWGAHLPPGDSRSFIGGLIELYVYDPNTDPRGERAIVAPAGTTYVLTLVPIGPLIDGSAGQTVEHSVTTDEATDSGSTTLVGAIVDVPVGQYEVMARIARPGDSPTDLLIGAACTGLGCPLRPQPQSTSATVEFTPIRTPIRPHQRQAVAGVQLYVTMP